MSTLQVANIHLESTQNNRIQYTGSNSLSITVAGSNALNINTTGTYFIGTINSVSYTTGTTGTGTGGVIANNTTIFVGNNTVNATLNTTGLNVNNVTIANTIGVYTTGTVNASSHTVGTSFIANSTQVRLAAGVGLSANGGLGTAGQVLTSNAVSIYWSTISTSTLLGIRVFTSGTTYTKTAGTNKIIAFGTGGGSGGKFVSGGGCNPAEYHSGGGGSTFISYVDVSAVSTLAYVIGAGGSGSVGGTPGQGGTTTLAAGVYGSAGGGTSSQGGGTSLNGTMNISGGIGSTLITSSSPAPGSSFWSGSYGIGGAGSGGAGTAGVLTIFEFA